MRVLLRLLSGRDGVRIQSTQDSKNEDQTKKKLIWIGIIVLAMFAINHLGATRVHTVTYTASGDARYTGEKAELTIQNASGGSEQRTVDLPWSLTMEKHSGDFLYLSAQASDTVSVIVDIVSDGVLVQHAECAGRWLAFSGCAESR
jgi:hypothetical protein